MAKYILVINSGSSSLKAKLFDAIGLTLVDKFAVSGIAIGADDKGDDLLASKLLAAFQDYIHDIEYCAHRIVAGGVNSIDAEEVDDNVAARIKSMSQVAPLHNPAAISVINRLKDLLPSAKHLTVYDSTFYNDLPAAEKYYAIDKNVAEELNLYKVGFHGISHRYAYNKSGFAKYDKVVSFHLGAGCSATAILNGRAVATSMGMTPLSGLIMQSRCGDIDPGVVFEIINAYGIEKARIILEKESGLKGLSQSSGSTLETLCQAGLKIEDETYIYGGVEIDEKVKDEALLALEMYCQRARDYIGMYASRMGGADAILFTGKVGFGSSVIRDKITYGLEYLNLKEVSAVDPDEEMAIAEIVRNKFL